MNKRRTLILLVSLVVIVTFVMLLLREGEFATLYDIRLQGWVEEVEPVTRTEEYEHATYVHDDYYLDGNHFRLTTIKMAHGDTLYFARNYSGAPNNIVTLQIVAKESAISKVMNLNHENKTWEKVNHKIASFSNALYVDGEKLSYRIGKIDTFLPLGHSVFQSIKPNEQEISRQSGRKKITYSIPLEATEDTLSETWGILATQRIINWDNEKAVKLASNIEFDDKKKLAVDGAYYLTPDSYRPYRENSYYLNPANLDGLRSLDYVADDSHGSLFKDISTHIAYSALRNQNSDGFWPTLPLSEWLKSEYNIGYAYMDNRRNVDNATFLLRYYLLNPDPYLLKTIEAWNRYHLSYIDQHKIPIENGGIFIPDYVDGNEKSETHSSLNHLAANLNYLLESYLFTKDIEQLEYAKQLLLGIKNTKYLWVAPDHNLYYSLSQDLKPNPLDDYDTLTRDDLMETQSLLQKVLGKTDEDIQYLIDQKNMWIEKNIPKKVR